VDFFGGVSDGWMVSIKVRRVDERVGVRVGKMGGHLKN